VQQKLLSSSFVSGLITEYPARFPYYHLYTILMQILHSIDFDAYVPAIILS
jgi:hypothetical protein